MTTLDLELNQKIEELLKDYVLNKAKPYKIDNGAVVVLDAKSGEILSLVGSYDFWETRKKTYQVHMI